MSHALRERGLVSMCWCKCLIARLPQFFVVVVESPTVLDEKKART